MSRILPPHPRLNHLKHEAKALLRAHREEDSAACETLRLLHRFKHSSHADVREASVALHEAQFALAMDYGFRSWDELRKHVEALYHVPADVDQARPGALLLADHPGGGEDGSRHARGLVLSLAHSGADCDYDTVMGDSGMAFILQTDANHTPWGKQIRKVDIGWWPLDLWGFALRLEFVGEAAGRRLTRLPADQTLISSDPARHFRERFETPITESLRSERAPVGLVGGYDIWVITGLDDGEPPLLGQRACAREPERLRLQGYPYEVIVVGDEVEGMPRSQADLEALRHAVALGHDRIEEPWARDHPRWSGLTGELSSGGRYTGQQSFALWARLLRDAELWGEHFYHANVVGHLRICRRCAMTYLTTMAQRHPARVSAHLSAAAEAYQQGLDTLASADTGKEKLHTEAGREQLARLVENIAAIEIGAVEGLEKAVAAMEEGR